ncbi:hypothetical protein SPFM15_00188 [Salmonella phage SPFM15]|nr:hypothetical protein SPFM5_00183 [Salmonella phage SPFM5]VFR13812.1 hypothetical protein SPFM15_00188 [Salmonella phage SPFM15]
MEWTKQSLAEVLKEATLRYRNAMAMEDAFTTGIYEEVEAMKSELKNLEGDEEALIKSIAARGTKNRVVGYTYGETIKSLDMHQCGKAIEAVIVVVEHYSGKVSWAIARDGDGLLGIIDPFKKVEAFPVPGNEGPGLKQISKSTNWAVKRAAGVVQKYTVYTRTALKKSKAFEDRPDFEACVKFSKQTNAYDHKTLAAVDVHTSSWTSKICLAAFMERKLNKLKTRMSLLDNDFAEALAKEQADRLKEITSKLGATAKGAGKLSKKLALRFYAAGRITAKAVKGTGKLVGAGEAMERAQFMTDTDPRAGIHRRQRWCLTDDGEDMLVARESRRLVALEGLGVKPDFPAVCAIKEQGMSTLDLDLEVLTDDHEYLPCVFDGHIATTTIL